MKKDLGKKAEELLKIRYIKKWHKDKEKRCKDFFLKK